MPSAARRASDRQRLRDLQGDRPAVLGALALAAGALLAYATLLGLAVAYGVAGTWPVLVWVPLGAVGLVILILVLLFLRDALRWRRAVASVSVAGRG